METRCDNDSSGFGLITTALRRICMIFFGTCHSSGYKSIDYYYLSKQFDVRIYELRSHAAGQFITHTVRVENAFTEFISAIGSNNKLKLMS